MYSLEIYLTSYPPGPSGGERADPERANHERANTKCEAYKSNQNRRRCSCFEYSRKERLLRRSVHVLPYLLTVASIIGISIDVYASYRTAAPLLTDPCASLPLNPDVSGAGVRISFYVSGAITIIIAILGHLHCKVTGVKAMSGLLLFAQICYSINLFKGLRWFRSAENTELSAVDALTGAMILNAYISAVSVTFSMKECMTARWLILSGLISQVPALVVVALVMAKLQKFSPGSPDANYRRFSAFWWGIFDTCNGASANFWLYFTLRGFTWVHNSWLCCQHMVYYDAAEKPKERNKRYGIQESVYDSIPATAFNKYGEWLAFFISSITSLELTLRSHNLQHTSRWAAWGQAQQIFVAMCSCLYLCFRFHLMFASKMWQEDKKLFGNLHIAGIQISSMTTTRLKLLSSRINSWSLSGELTAITHFVCSAYDQQIMPELNANIWLGGRSCIATLSSLEKVGSTEKKS